MKNNVIKIDFWPLENHFQKGYKIQNFDYKNNFIIIIIITWKLLLKIIRKMQKELLFKLKNAAQ